MNREINGFPTYGIHGAVKAETRKFTSQRHPGLFLKVGKSSNQINQPSTLKWMNRKDVFSILRESTFHRSLSARLFSCRSFAAVLFVSC